MLHKIKLIASDQVEAVKLASMKAEALNMEVYRVEEVEVLEEKAVSFFVKTSQPDDLGC